MCATPCSAEEDNVLDHMRWHKIALRLLEEQRGLYVAVVRGPQDRNQLIAAVRAALGLVGDVGSRYFAN